MPVHLGLGAGDLIAYPALAYPTYEVGAALAGARAVATDSLTSLGPEAPRLLWLNSPVQPDRPGAARRAPAQGGRVVPRARHDPGLRRVLPRVRVGGRRRSRCCTPTSAAAATRASSPSTRSPSAPTSRATAARSSPATRHSSASCSPSARTSGCRCPGPSRRAMIAALDDDDARGGAARAVRRPPRQAARGAPGRGVPHRPLRGVALPVEHPRRGLLGHRRPALADLGILVAPGDFYGPSGRRHVRVAFTATDERIDAAVARLAP